MAPCETAVAVINSAGPLFIASQNLFGQLEMPEHAQGTMRCSLMACLFSLKVHSFIKNNKKKPLKTSLLVALPSLAMHLYYVTINRLAYQPIIVVWELEAQRAFISIIFKP